MLVGTEGKTSGLPVPTIGYGYVCPTFQYTAVDSMIYSDTLVLTHFEKYESGHPWIMPLGLSFPKERLSHIRLYSLTPQSHSSIPLSPRFQHHHHVTKNLKNYLRRPPSHRLTEPTELPLPPPPQRNPKPNLLLRPRRP